MVPPPWGDNDLDTAGEWLEKNANLVEKWLVERASPALVRRLHTAALQASTTSEVNSSDVHPPSDVPPPSSTNSKSTNGFKITNCTPDEHNNNGHRRDFNKTTDEQTNESHKTNDEHSTKRTSLTRQQSFENNKSFQSSDTSYESKQQKNQINIENESRKTSISSSKHGSSPDSSKNVSDLLKINIDTEKRHCSSTDSLSIQIPDSRKTSLSIDSRKPSINSPSHNSFDQSKTSLEMFDSRKTSINIDTSHLDNNLSPTTSDQCHVTEHQLASLNLPNTLSSDGTVSRRPSTQLVQSPKSILQMIHSTKNPLGSSTSRRTSITSDLFQLWLAASPIKNSTSGTLPSKRDLTHLNESELFMELIRDVANELDIDVLCHKILVNVGLLTHADRGSLFLARGPSDNRYLVAKLFDVRQDTELEEAVQRARSEEIIIPFGTGIAGTVAQSKEIINITDAYEDPRFNSEVDMRTGYKTNLILCMPICNYEGDVIGVAQIINKTNDSNEFTEHDVEVFQRYLTFCGIGIQNAQLFEVSVLEYRRNQILLNLARSIFEEQSNLECLVTKIMTEAQELLKCERCAVFLLDLDCCEASHLQRIVERPADRMIPDHRPLSRRESGNLAAEDMRLSGTRSMFTTVFELKQVGSETIVTRPTPADLQHSTLAQISSYVANTGQILNIGDVRKWLKHEPDEDAKSARTILCMPIVNGQKSVIGVAQLINKANNALFTECDVSLFEAFAIFCGLGIHNTQMYENACKLMAKQKVALECLSYHATASTDATIKLLNDDIPSAETYNLYSFTFIDFDLSDEDTCRAAIRMFMQCNLVEQFHIPYDVLCRWILSVRKNYRPVKYHNWRHALNVAQTMFAMLKTGKLERFMNDLDILGLLVACLCHDLDHRGTNNAFQTKTESPLAILYSTSTMEHHHFDQCVMILNSDCNNIFQALSPEDYKNVMKTVETAILSTDLAMYFKKKSKFMELIDNGEFDFQSDEKKELLCGMMMTACDVSAIAKPWDVQHRVAKMVADEFFDQGDLERLQLKQQPVAMMDRERKDELPQMQVGFIDYICLPLYRVMSETFPWVKPLYEGTMENRKHWQDLAEKVEMGLTWIDHDTIDKPIEAFEETEAVKELEFTVTTLHQQSSLVNTIDTTTKSTTSTSYHPRLANLKSKSFSKAVRVKLSRSTHSSSAEQSSNPETPLTSKSKPLKHRTKLCSLL